MPKTLQRLLLIAFLAVAVPLQGYAAAGIELCRAFAHHDDPVAAAAAQHAHQVTEGVGAHHDVSGSPRGGTGQESYHCAACASCGVAAVISDAPGSYASDAPRQGIDTVSLPAPKGYVPEGLDRPPLSLLV